MKTFLVAVVCLIIFFNKSQKQLTNKDLVTLTYFALLASLMCISFLFWLLYLANIYSRIPISVWNFDLILKPGVSITISFTLLSVVVGILIFFFLFFFNYYDYGNKSRLKNCLWFIFSSIFFLFLLFVCMFAVIPDFSLLARLYTTLIVLFWFFWLFP